MLENEKKTRGREREKGGRDGARKSRGIRQAGKWEEVASGRPWGLYEEHFTHKEHPSRVLTPGWHVLAKRRKGRWEGEKKNESAGLWAGAILRSRRRKENVMGIIRRSDLKKKCYKNLVKKLTFKTSCIGELCWYQLNCLWDNTRDYNRQ